MMETRDEFIKELKKEVDSLVVKYESDVAAADDDRHFYKNMYDDDSYEYYC